MTAPFIDTDVIIRFLTGDDEAKRLATRALFRRIAAGRETVAAPVTVIADAVYVLSSPRTYALSRSQVRALLAPIVKMQHFQVPHRGSLLRALDVYAVTNIDFGDAMIVAAMERAVEPQIYSYDRDFDRFPAIRRQEPGGEPQSDNGTT